MSDYVRIVLTISPISSDVSAELLLHSLFFCNRLSWRPKRTCFQMYPPFTILKKYPSYTILWSNTDGFAPGQKPSNFWIQHQHQAVLFVGSVCCPPWALPGTSVAWPVKLDRTSLNRTGWCLQTICTYLKVQVDKLYPNFRMEHDGTWWNMMEHDGTWWNMMQHDGTWWNMMEHISCSMLLL